MDREALATADREALATADREVLATAGQEAGATFLLPKRKSGLNSLL